MENNKDLMGWNAPGSNNSSDEENSRQSYGLSPSDGRKRNRHY